MILLLHVLHLEQLHWINMIHATTAHRDRQFLHSIFVNRPQPIMLNFHLLPIICYCQSSAQKGIQYVQYYAHTYCNYIILLATLETPDWYVVIVLWCSALIFTYYAEYYAHEKTCTSWYNIPHWHDYYVTKYVIKIVI